MPIRAVIFDFDGLMLDTERIIFESWQLAYRQHGHELGMDLWQLAIGTVGGFDACAHLAELTGLAFDREALRAEVHARHVEGCRQLALLPGVRETLGAARALGLKTAVASSSSYGWVHGWLSQHQLLDQLDAVCARDHVERPKPAPDLYLLAASRIGVEPAACLAFEDSPNGVRAARSAGLLCVAVPNAITRTLAFPPTDMVLSSLAERPLSGLLALLDARRIGEPR